MKARTVVTAAGLAALCAVSARAARHALLVGSREGGAGYARLHYIDRDLEGMREILVEHCGFAPENVAVIRNEEPAAVRIALKRLRERFALARADLFFFYYTGHAAQDALLMQGKRLGLAELKHRLEPLESSIKISVFDACQSGSFARLKGGQLAKPFMYAPRSAISGQVVLYSSSANENSQESDLYRGSVFTFHLVNALRGAADISGDGKVTLSEAYQYAYHNTVSSTAHSAGGVQHPGYLFRIQGEGNVVLSDIAPATSGLALEPGVEGQVAVIDGRGAVVAELTKKSESRVAIALRPGAYSIINNRGDYALKTSARVDGKVASVEPASFRRVRSYSAQVKGAHRSNPALSFAALGGYGAVDHENIELGLRRAYAQMSHFGIHPSIEVSPGAALYGAETSVQLPAGLFWSARVDYTSLLAHGSFRGVRESGYDKESYSAKLDIAAATRQTTLQGSAGYRFRRGVLKQLACKAGLDYVTGGITVSGDFYDALFDIADTNTYRQTIRAVCTFAGLDYRIPLFRGFSLSGSVYYRKQLADFRDDGLFDMQADGLRASLSLVSILHLR